MLGAGSATRALVQGWQRRFCASRRPAESRVSHVTREPHVVLKLCSENVWCTLKSNYSGCLVSVLCVFSIS